MLGKVDARRLRRLCRRLVPASLQIEGGEPRRRTFLVGVGRDRGGWRLALDPLPGCPSHRTRAVLDVSVADGRFRVSGTLVPTSATTAEMALESGPLERPPRGVPLAAPTGLAVLSCVTAGERSRWSRRYAVLDLGSRHCRIETGAPLAVNTVLGQLAIIVHQDVIRRGEGVVARCAPVLNPGGRLVYECDVRYGAASRLPAAPAVDGGEVADPERVRTILWALCDLQCEVVVSNASRTSRGRLRASPGGDRARLPELHVLVAAPGDLPAGGPVTVACSLFGRGYRFTAEVLDRAGAALILSAPPTLCEWRRRGDERTSFEGDAGARISFRHPLTRLRWIRPLIDFTARGFAFSGEGLDHELWDGLPLEDVRIILGQLTCRADEVAVRWVSAGRVGAAMSGLRGRGAAAMRARVLEHGPSPIRLHDGQSFDAIVAFHRSMDLLEPDMAANLQVSFGEAKRVWGSAHHGSAGLMQTAVVPWNGGVGATLTSVRAYERTWILQHSAVASAAVPTGAGQLHAVLMRLAAPRQDGEFIAGTIDASAPAYHRLINGFFASSVSTLRGATGMVLYAAPAVAGPQASCAPAGREDRAVRIQPLRGRDERLVESAGALQIDPACARALSLRTGEVELPRTRAAYRALGIERSRRAFGAFSGDRCAAVLLQEIASPGLCLSGLLSAALLLPLAPVGDPDGSRRRALAVLARSGDVPGGSPNRFLFMPQGNDESPLLETGWRRVGPCTFFALHRLEIDEYQRYVAERYGLLKARLRGRKLHLTEAA